MDIRIPADRRALVVGGAGGLGAAICHALSASGVRVAAADVSQSALDNLKATDESVVTLRMDVSDPRSVSDAVAAASHELGGIDTLVNAAGVIQLCEFDQVSVDDWDRIISVNLRGVFLTTKGALPDLIESRRGCIVNIASDAGKRGFPYISSYVASKFGVVGLTQALAAELGPAGVRVNAVCPATIPDTGMGQKVLEQKVELSCGGTNPREVLERGAASFPLRRLGRVDDVVNVVMFLISDAASWISGESINVDGGALSG